MNSNILIVGKGFVGDAVGFVLSKRHTIFYYDPYKNENYNMRQLDNLDGVVLCVPTPSDETGGCDDSLVLDYYLQIREKRKDLHILIKSTTSIETLNRLQCEEDEHLTFSPEFLVADRAREDMVHAPFFIYSSISSKSPIFWTEVFKGCVKNVENSIFCDSMVEAGFLKYAINSFLATKVTFMNELYALFNRTTNGKGNFDNVTAMMAMDRRIGSSHMQVPGPDGKFGWGGACFPKDTSEFVQLGQLMEEPLTVLEAARRANRSHRETE
jgi:nucleotide sugar dehydrogenase